MNSFANDVRNEIARVIPKKLCCQKSELMSLLRMSSTNFVSNEAFDFSTSNAAIARKILLLTNSIDPTVKTRIEMKKVPARSKNYLLKCYKQSRHVEKIRTPILPSWQMYSAFQNRP